MTVAEKCFIPLSLLPPSPCPDASPPLNTADIETERGVLGVRAEPSAYGKWCTVCIMVADVPKGSFSMRGRHTVSGFPLITTDASETDNFSFCLRESRKMSVTEKERDRAGVKLSNTLFPLSLRSVCLTMSYYVPVTQRLVCPAWVRMGKEVLSHRLSANRLILFVTHNRPAAWPLFLWSIKMGSYKQQSLQWDSHYKTAITTRQTL